VGGAGRKGGRKLAATTDNCQRIWQMTRSLELADGPGACSCALAPPEWAISQSGGESESSPMAMQR
jgi:hypothetical protein